jgi:hypothetical protein
MIVLVNTPNKPENGKLGESTNEADQLKPRHLVDEGAILSGLVNAIETLEGYANQSGESSSGESTLSYRIKTEGSLINQWKITVKIDPRLKTKRKGSIKIEAYLD